MWFRLVCLFEHCSAAWDNAKAGLLTAWHNNKNNLECGSPCSEVQKVMFYPREKWDSFETTGVLQERVIGSFLVGIHYVHPGDIFADYYEDDWGGRVYAFRTGKVFKCFFYIANLSKNWGFFGMQLPVNFRTQLIQAPSNFKKNNHYSIEILSIIARFTCLFS